MVRAQPYRERLLAYAARVLGDREEAEDVVQEVLLKVRRANLREPKALSGWLHAVTYRQAVDRLRARQREDRTLKALPRPEASGPQAGPEQREQLDLLRGALAQLEEPFQTALRLRYLEGLSFQEVAAQTRTPERTARSRVARGLAKLRGRLRTKR